MRLSSKDQSASRYSRAGETLADVVNPGLRYTVLLIAERAELSYQLCS